MIKCSNKELNSSNIYGIKTKRDKKKTKKTKKAMILKKHKKEHK